MVVQSFVRTDVSLSSDRNKLTSILSWAPAKQKKKNLFFYFNYWRVLNARAISFPGNCLGGDSRNAVCGKGHLKYCINWWASGLRYVGTPPLHKTNHASARETFFTTTRCLGTSNPNFFINYRILYDWILMPIIIFIKLFHLTPKSCSYAIE